MLDYSYIIHDTKIEPPKAIEMVQNDDITAHKNRALVPQVYIPK